MKLRVYGLLAFIAASTPLALAVETGLRRVFFPPDFADLRLLLRPILTPWMWWVIPTVIPMTVLGFGVQRFITRRQLSQIPSAEERSPDRIEAASFDALMLSTSCPQIPALISTFGFMFGSELRPVLVTIAVATIGVLSLGLTLPRATMGRARGEDDCAHA